MLENRQLTLFALDCGATNWRLYRMEYTLEGPVARTTGSPQPSPLTSFVDRKLPAVICLNADGTALESIGEVAQQQLEDERCRERVREQFKPCIGSHLELNPLPHQKRYTHVRALDYTRMLLAVILEQLRHEKWRSGFFDDRICFSFAYPVHWRYEHEGKVFDDFVRIVRGCFESGFEGVRFVAEPEGAILWLRHQGQLGKAGNQLLTLIVDVGGSTTDIVAGGIEPSTNNLSFIGRYGEAFGGGLYDAELAHFIANELRIPDAVIAEDPSAMLSLRLSGQRLKESLSRQLLQAGRLDHIPQRSITLVMQGGDIYRRVVALDEVHFREITCSLDQHYQALMDRALKTMSVAESEIGQVVLVGGGAQLFTIVAHLRERFGAGKVLLADNPEEIVVQGIGLEFGASLERIQPAIQFPVKLRTEEKRAQEPHVIAWRLEASGSQPTWLPIGTTSVGRGEGNELQLDDPKVSRKHARLQVSDGTLTIVDLGSTNGTFVNKRRIPPNQSIRLEAGDEISFGRSKFVCAR